MTRAGRGGTSAVRRIGLWVFALAGAVGLAALARWGTGGDGDGSSTAGSPASSGVDSAGADERVQLESPPAADGQAARTEALPMGWARAMVPGTRRGAISGRVFAKSATYDPASLARLRGGLAGGARADALGLELALAEAPAGLAAPLEWALAGVKVVASDSIPVRYAQHVARAWTDERGHYAFEDLTPGRWIIGFDAPWDLLRYGPQEGFGNKVVEVGPGKAEVIDFPLLALVVTLTGRVVDTALEPIAGASVTHDTLDIVGLVQVTPGRQFRTMGIVEETTDAQGGYALTGVLAATLDEAREYLAWGTLSPDAHAVTVEAEGHVPARVVVVPILPDLARFLAALSPESPSVDAPQPSYSKGAILLPDLVLAASASISGVVVTSGGEALPNARVRVVPVDPESAIPRPLTPAPVAPDWVLTDERGAFRVADLAPGSYLFEVTSRATGLLRAKNPPLAVLEGVRTEDVRVVVRTDGEGTIVGTVVDEITGEPVESFSVVTMNQGRSAGVRGKAGSFRLEHVPAGATSVTVHARRYASAEVSIDVTGGAVNELRVSLHRSGIVEGLLEVDGVSVSGTVYAVREDGSRGDLAGGRFDEKYWIEGLESGRSYALVAYLQGARGVEGELVAHASVVPMADQVVRHEFTLQRPKFAIHGVVTSPGKDSRWQIFAFEGHSLYLVEPHLSPFLRAMVSGVGASGEFRLPVPPGTYTVLGRRLASDASGVPLREVSQGVTVGEGADATADFDLE